MPATGLPSRHAPHGRTTLSEKLLDSLGRQIVSGGFAGKRFPTEAELCESYSTSRSVTREAIKMLASKGMLRARPHVGIVVLSEEHWSLLDADVLRWMLDRPFSYGLFRAFTELRLGIEPAAAALAAQAASPVAIGRIDAALAQMLAAADAGEDLLEADVRFHMAILEATGNPFYLQFRRMVDSALRISIQLTGRLDGTRASSIEAHQCVARAIREGDAAAAQASMLGMIKGILELAAKAEAAEVAEARVAARRQRLAQAMQDVAD